VRRILVIESDQQFRKLLTELLASDFRVTVFDDEQTAHRFLLVNTVDLTLYDVGRKETTQIEFFINQFVSAQQGRFKWIAMSGEPKKLQALQGNLSATHVKGQDRIEDLINRIHSVLDG